MRNKREKVYCHDHLKPTGRGGDITWAGAMHGKAGELQEQFRDLPHVCVQDLINISIVHEDDHSAGGAQGDTHCSVPVAIC